jgi:hypothetical protein
MNPQRMRASSTSERVVKIRARQPPRLEKTAKAERLPVERRLWLEVIWGTLERRERGMERACRNLTSKGEVGGVGKGEGDEGGDGGQGGEVVDGMNEI